MIRRFKLWWRCRGLQDWQKENVRCGLPKDFKLPYPGPRATL